MKDEIISPNDENESQMTKREESLLDVFTEENLHCHNLRKMNSSLTRCFNVLQEEVESNANQLIAIPPKMLKAVSAFLKGQELKNAEGMLVADLDALSSEIRQKIKQGIYEIAESKQIDGNLRAAVVDKNKKIIKQITLKHADGNKIVAGDLNTMAIQAALREITQQLNCIDAGIKYLITLKRRSDFQTPYFDAVKKVDAAKRAKNETIRNERVQSAIDDLNHGLSGLYGDLDDCIEMLQGKWIPIASNRCLSYISEDMVYIPQYVALLAYLYNYQGNTELAREAICYYRDELNQFVSKQLKNGYTAAQLVHTHFHYQAKNQDFWIDGMRKIQTEINAIKNLPAMDGREGKPVYYLLFSDNNAKEEEDNV